MTARTFASTRRRRSRRHWLPARTYTTPRPASSGGNMTDTGSIAKHTSYLDDPNLLAVIDNPDFDLFDDIVGGLNYTGYITDSPDYYAENADDYPDAPDYDERDEMFAQIASEDGWVIASPENVRAAVQSHMAEHGGEAPPRKGERHGKAPEIAAWKENHVPSTATAMRRARDAQDGQRQPRVHTSPTATMRKPGTGVTAPTTIPSPARRPDLEGPPSPPRYGGHLPRLLVPR